MNIQQFWESVLAQDEQKIRTYFQRIRSSQWMNIGLMMAMRPSGGRIKK